MQHSTKRKIAKEVIVFFCCVTFIGITWFAFWTINYFNYSKRDNIKKQITDLNYKRDSLKSIFPKLKSFEEIIVDKSAPFDPDKYLAQIEWEKYRLPLVEEVIETNPELKPWENAAYLSNLRQLYKLLEILKYPTVINYINVDGLPVYKNIKKVIPSELERDFEEMNELHKIHHFLKSKKCMTVPFNEFISNIKGLSLPPPHTMWETYEATRKQIAQLNQQLIKTNSKIYSNNDLSLIGKWIAIIAFIIVYLLRFLVLTLMWALATLNKKPI